MSRQLAYYNQILPYAERVAARLNTHPHNIIAQLALESNWGKSVLPGTYNHGNIMELRKNVAGTHANDNGNHRKFRHFANDQDFFDHYGGLLQRKYKNTMGAQSAADFGKALKAGGYAEDPNYVNSIIKMRNAVNKVSGGGYVWNGQPTTNEPLQTMNQLAGNTQQSNSGNFKIDGTAGGSAGLSILGQPIGGDVNEPRRQYQAGTLGNNTLLALFGNPQYQNSFWRS